MTNLAEINDRLCRLERRVRVYRRWVIFLSVSTILAAALGFSSRTPRAQVHGSRLSAPRIQSSARQLQSEARRQSIRREVPSKVVSDLPNEQRRAGGDEQQSNVVESKQQHHEVLSTEMLVLTDNDRRPRGMLSAKDGEPVLSLIDQRNVERIQISVEDDKATISLFDGGHRTRLKLAGSENSTEVVLFDDDERPTVRLRGGHREPQVVVYDSAGQSRTRLFVITDETTDPGSGVSLVDAKGANRLLLTTLPDGTAIIRAGTKNVALEPSSTGAKK